MKTPVTIFTGFLGSGKTTIISHLVDSLRAQNVEVVYIKNEIGSENIDTQLLEGKHIQTKELLNGCICCTLVGPFMSAIDEVLDTFKPDRIIIEASGAADPSAIALMISSHPRLSRDGVISIIDVINFEGYQDLSETARNQATFTDLIVFNKVELADLDRKQAVVGYVRELNSVAPIVEAPAGQLAPDLALGVSSQDLVKRLQGMELHDHEHHLEEDNLTSLTLTLDRMWTAPELQSALKELPSGVFRVKGVMTDPEGQQWLINRVGTRTELTPLTVPIDAELNQKLVFIGFAHTEWQNSLTHLTTQKTLGR